MRGIWGLAAGMGILAAAQVFAATELTLKKGDGLAEFHGVGTPSALKVNGKTTDFEGKAHATASGFDGTFVVELSTLDTGIKMRNEHTTKKYLETGKFPKATLHVTKVDGVKAGAPIAAGSFPFSGDIEIHGQTKPITGTIAVKAPSGGKLPFEATFPVKISEFGITKPSFMGVSLQDEVGVAASGLLQVSPENATKY